MRFGLQLCCHFMQVLTNWSELGSQQLLRFLVRKSSKLHKFMAFGRMSQTCGSVPAFAV